MIWFYVPALLAALVVTVLELTEVVALVFALGVDHGTVRHGALGAVAGVLVVALIALGAGALLIAIPLRYLLWGSAGLLAGFGVFLFRSSLKTYRRRRAAAVVTAPPATSAVAVQFAGGFTVGAIETTEAVVVLLALTAAGYGISAAVGALVGGFGLVVAALLVHERIRRIKTAWLKLGATSMVFAFAVFWGGEAAGLRWPYSDAFLVPLFVAGVLLVRGGLELFLRRDGVRTPAVPG
jgi:uncharacterized membrane protein